MTNIRKPLEGIMRCAPQMLEVLSPFCPFLARESNIAKQLNVYRMKEQRRRVRPVQRAEASVT
jgi:hypothetical protein